MTREEAIKVLRAESVEIGGNAVSVCRFWEALDMAVKALEDVTVKDVGKMTNADRIRAIEQAISDSEDGVPCDHLIEVSPVRHGRWESWDDGFGGTYYRCSVCGEDWCIIDGTPAENGMRYCPQCGARMDGDNDD